MVNVLNKEFVTLVNETVIRLVTEKELEPKVVIERPKGHRGRMKGSNEYVTREAVAVTIGLDSKNLFLMNCIGEVIKEMVGYSCKSGCGIVKI